MEFSALPEYAKDLMVARNGHTATYIPSRNSILVVGGGLRPGISASAQEMVEIQLDEKGLPESSAQVTFHFVRPNSTDLPATFGHTAVLLEDTPERCMIWTLGGTRTTLSTASHVIELTSGESSQLTVGKMEFTAVGEALPEKLWGQSIVGPTASGEYIMFGGCITGEGETSDAWKLQINQPAEHCQFSLVQVHAEDTHPKPRRRHVAALHENQVHMFVFGGRSDSWTTYSDLWCFNSELETWREIMGTEAPAVMRLPYCYPQDKAIDSFARNLSDESDPLRVDERPGPRTGHVGALVTPTKFLVYGGMHTPNPYRVHSDAWYFDLVEHRWCRCDNLTELSVPGEEGGPGLDLGVTMPSLSCIAPPPGNPTLKKQFLVMGGLSDDISVRWRRSGFIMTPPGGDADRQLSLKNQCAAWLAVATARKRALGRHTAESSARTTARFARDCFLDLHHGSAGATDVPQHLLHLICSELEQRIAKPLV